MELLAVLIVLALLAVVGGLLLWALSACCTFMVALLDSGGPASPPN